MKLSSTWTELKGWIKFSDNLCQNVAPGYYILDIVNLQQSDCFECGLHIKLSTYYVNINILLSNLNVYILDSFY